MSAWAPAVMAEAAELTGAGPWTAQERKVNVLRPADGVNRARPCGLMHCATYQGWVSSTCQKSPLSHRLLKPQTASWLADYRRSSSIPSSWAMAQPRVLLRAARSTCANVSPKRSRNPAMYLAVMPRWCLRRLCRTYSAPNRPSSNLEQAGPDGAPILLDAGFQSGKESGTSGGDDGHAGVRQRHRQGAFRQRIGDQSHGRRP